MTCNKCLEYRTGGNNHILSLILIKYSKLQLKCFMTIIHNIIIQKKIYNFEQSELESFHIKENNIDYTFEQYLIYKIDSISLINNDNDYFFILRSLFIISLLYDQRVKLFIFGDHTKISKISTKLHSKINITLFLTKCEHIIDDFKNNIITLTDIAYYSSNEWREIGLFVI